MAANAATFPSPAGRSAPIHGMKLALLLPFARGILRFRGPLLRMLRRFGHEVVVLSPDPGPAIVQGLRDLGVAWREIPLARGGLSPRADLAAIRAMAAALREISPDLFLGFNPKGVLHGSLAAAEAGVPRRFAMVTGLGFAFTPRAGLASGLTVRLARWASLRLARRALPTLHGLAFQNPDDREILRIAGVLPATLPTAVIPGTGVDCERFAPTPLPDRPALLMASRLLETKGVREYFEAASRLHDPHPDAPCRLAGWIDPGLAAIPKRDLDDLLAAGHVEFLGRLDDVRPAIAAASVCVLPSHREGLPLFLLEAMAMGRAVIATDVPGCREAVEPGVTGLLVPPRDPGALAEAMIALATDPARVAAMGEAGRRRAVDRFESDSTCRRLLEFVGVPTMPPTPEGEAP